MAQARAADAAAGRARRRRLRHQADEAQSFAAVLLDLAERGAPLAVHTTTGGVHHGRLLTVGRDFVAVETRAGTTVLIVAGAVAAVRAAGAPAGAGDRSTAGAATFLDALGELATEGSRVRVVVGSGEAFSGDVRWVGADVVALAADGAAPELAYLPCASVSEVTFFGSG